MGVDIQEGGHCWGLQLLLTSFLNLCCTERRKGRGWMLKKEGEAGGQPEMGANVLWQQHLLNVGICELSMHRSEAA